MHCQRATRGEKNGEIARKCRCSHRSVCCQCQAAGASGPSGLRAPGPVERSRCPATGAAAVPSPRLEEQPALEKKKYTTGSECSSRDSPALLSPSARVRGNSFTRSSTLWSVSRCPPDKSRPPSERFHQIIRTPLKFSNYFFFICC